LPVDKIVDLQPDLEMRLMATTTPTIVLSPIATTITPATMSRITPVQSSPWLVWGRRPAIATAIKVVASAIALQPSTVAIAMIPGRRTWPWDGSDVEIMTPAGVYS
jgi:hypothetical protein